MEFTKEKLLHVEKISADPEKRELASALLAELDKPKVWDSAPEWATNAGVRWSAKTHYSGVYKEYTRELPKTRIDEIAEEVGIEEGKKYGWSPAVIVSAIEIAKAAILKYREEREAN